MGGNIKTCKVKPVSRGHLWDNEKWSFKTGDLLKEILFHMKFSMTGQEKGVLLIRVTASVLKMKI